MEIKAKTLSLIVTLLIATICNAVEPWRINKSIDPMTDELTYIVYTVGSKVSIGEYLSYNPELVFRIKPKNLTESGGMKYKADIMFVIETDGLRSENAQIMTRYDRNAPTTEYWDTSTDRHAAFAPDWQAAMRNIESSTNLLIRYTTTLGHVRTTRFDVRNLLPTLKEVKRSYMASGKATIEHRGPNTETSIVQPVANEKETELIAKATASMKDITHALAYARSPDGPIPSMKSETTLNKPLAALEKAIAKKKQAADNLETIERRFNNLNPGNLSRPSPEKLARARTTLKNAEKELSQATAEVRNATRKILQETDWPTPELSAKAESLAARIPYRNTTY